MSGSYYSSIYVYAYWTKKANTITITLNKNGGSGGTSYLYYKYGTNTFYSNYACTSTISSISIPSKSGYTFSNYHGDGSCGGSNGESYIQSNGTWYSDLCTDIYKDATLYASWTSSYSYPTYIQSSGTQYINTGFSASGGMTCEYKATFLNDDSTATHGVIVGSHNADESSGGWGRNLAYWSARTQWEFGYGNTYYWLGSGAVNTIYTVKFSTLYSNAYLTVNGTTLISGKSGQTVSTNNVYLLTHSAILAEGRGSTSARVYYVKIWNSSGTLVRNFVPCINPSGTVGMWDYVNSKFYSNSGSGTFSYG